MAEQSATGFLKALCLLLCVVMNPDFSDFVYVCTATLRNASSFVQMNKGMQVQYNCEHVRTYNVTQKTNEHLLTFSLPLYLRTSSDDQPLHVYGLSLSLLKNPLHLPLNC